MEDFWKSVQTIQAERGADYRAFSLFSATHWAELLGAAAVIFLCAVIYYRCREVTRHQILRAVFVLMLADEFMKQAVLLYTGQWNVTYLPLHLCSMQSTARSTPVTRCGARRQIWPFWMRLTAARTQTGTLASKNSVWRPCSA